MNRLSHKACFIMVISGLNLSSMKVKVSRRDVGMCLLSIAEKGGEKGGSGLGWRRISAYFWNFNSFCLLLRV